MKMQFVVDSNGKVLAMAPVHAPSHLPNAGVDAPNTAGVMTVSENGDQSVHEFDVPDDVLSLSPEKLYSRFRLDLTSKKAKLIDCDKG